MKVEYINPFLSSAISVFNTMLGTSLTRGEAIFEGRNST